MNTKCPGNYILFMFANDLKSCAILTATIQGESPAEVRGMSTPMKFFICFLVGGPTILEVGPELDRELAGLCSQ
jgi:hypothetical protein